MFVTYLNKLTRLKSFHIFDTQINSMCCGGWGEGGSVPLFVRPPDCLATRAECTRLSNHKIQLKHTHTQ